LKGKRDPNEFCWGGPRKRERAESSPERFSSSRRSQAGKERQFCRGTGSWPQNAKTGEGTSTAQGENRDGSRGKVALGHKEKKKRKKTIEKGHRPRLKRGLTRVNAGRPKKAIFPENTGCQKEVGSAANDKKGCRGSERMVGFLQKRKKKHRKKSNRKSDPGRKNTASAKKKRSRRRGGGPH